ncbi:hypothetical protein F3Y22_tig00110299pilonHSYRG00334 [Hibiscus syriacus]|uniref:Disease resistance protein At4g27190-like leucine-rich repeats domain-containing protein n=1 Tax=Hibiscus syriacus TaxID=106335 RepID=A0A6A3B7U0_HIBSY|nr:hypothetical protein F3Y22_tig00110299pilonHSYRG00334 [Hibiscus syriacus]
MWQEQLFSVPTCIQNLTTITVEGCDNLKFLLSSSMVPSLEQLIHLEISDYKLMAGIIEEAMTEERMEKIVFPKLSSLKIKGLPRLTRFCSGKAVQFPSLNQLRIEHCPKLGTFISNSMKKGIQPLFDEKVAFPSLEKMVISQLRNLKILWNDQLPESSFCELKTMEVENCSQLQTVFPFNMVERFRRLQALSLKSLFPASVARGLPQLESVEIDTCGVEHIVAMDETPQPETRLEFPKLTFLQIWKLIKLKSFYPGDHSTENLNESLKVDEMKRILKLSLTFEHCYPTLYIFRSSRVNKSP